jgi:hypothetical protein
MAGTLRSLDRRLGAALIIINKKVEQFIGEVGVSIGEILVPATPVLTGYARGNWQSSLRAPATQPISFLDPTGSAAVSRIRLTASSYSLGDTLYIVNNAPYIGKLNRGSSQQAPAGFVEASVREGLNRAKSFSSLGA